MEVIIKNRCEFNCDGEYAGYLRELRDKHRKITILQDIYYAFLEDWADNLIKENEDLEKELRTP